MPVKFVGGTTFTISHNDYVTVIESYVLNPSPAYLGNNRDFLLTCQWREWPQSSQYFQEENWRVFTRDVNGDGITDSVNLFSDATAFTGRNDRHYNLYMMSSQGFFAYATLWIEMQGFTFEGEYSETFPLSCFPILKIQPSCYYPDWRIAIHIATSKIGGDVLTVPAVDVPSGYPAEWYSQHDLTIDRLFCSFGSPAEFVVARSQSTIITTSSIFSSPNLEVFIGSNWPQRRNVIDFYTQMGEYHCPDTVSFEEIASIPLKQLWSEWYDYHLIADFPYKIAFNGDFAVSYEGQPITDFGFRDSSYRTNSMEFGLVINEL